MKETSLSSTAMVIVLLLTASLTTLISPAHAAGHAGFPAWTNRYSGDLFHWPFIGLAVDCAGNAFIAGSCGSNSYFSDYVTIAYSNAGLPLWTNRYNGPANGVDRVTAVAVSSNGNVIVTGYSDGLSGTEFATIAYLNSGMPLWTNRYSGGGAISVKADGNGNVIVTGSSNPLGCVTIKYSGAGAALWTNVFYECDPSALATDGNGIFVTGQDDQNRYVTIRISPSGEVLWAKQDAVGGDDDPVGILLNGGNVFVTGYSENVGDYDDADYATVAYSGAGVPLWTNRYQGPAYGYDSATALAAGTNGQVVVTGVSDRINNATIAYASSGQPLWTNRSNGTSGSSAIATDGNGNVFVLHSAVIAYSHLGMPLWTNRYDDGTGKGFVGQAVAVDGTGNVFVTGTSLNSNVVTIKFAASAPPFLTPSLTSVANGQFRLNTTYFGGLPLTVVAATNISSQLSNWTRLGSPVETSPGKFEFFDNALTNQPMRFYRVYAQ